MDDIKKNQQDEILDENENLQEEEKIENPPTEEPETAEEEPTIDLFELEKKLNENEDIDIEEAKNIVKSKIVGKEEFITITDDYIKSQPPEYQPILKSIRGETLSPKALKNYINAELYINRIKTQKTEKPEKTQPQKTETQPPKTSPTINITPSENIDTTIYLTLKSKYNLPELESEEDPKEKIKDYLVDLQITDPLQYYEFLKDYEHLKNIVPIEFKKMEEIKNNWKEINVKNLENGYQKFVEKLSSYGIKPEDLNIDFNISDNNVGKDIYNVILKDENTLDPDVVDVYYNQYPIVREDKVYEKLIRLYFDKILELKNNSKPELRIKKEVPPSMSNYPTKGKTFNKLPVDSLLELNSYEIDDETLEKYKEQLKSSIIGIK